MSRRGDTVCVRLGETTKAQGIRLLDVFLIGPLMMWGGQSLYQQGHRLAGPALLVLGVGTVIYNAGNYARVRALLAHRERG